MDTRYLTYILTIAEERNMTRAAKKLYVSQSSLSQYLTRLEQELGTPLFLRTRGELVLTPAGELYAQAAKKVLGIKKQLCKDIAELDARRDALKAKVKVAKTQERLNKIGASVEGARSNLSAFDRMEAKVDKMLDEANAMAQLNQSSQESSIEDLKDKYDSEPSSQVDDELAALKAKLGK